MGMVNTVVPLEKLEDTYVKWCKTIMKRSPLAIRMLKRALNAELDGQAGMMEFAGDATLMYYLMEERRRQERVPGEARPRLPEVPQVPPKAAWFGIHPGREAANLPLASACVLTGGALAEPRAMWASSGSSPSSPAVW